jgi:hypothetical protein
MCLLEKNIFCQFDNCNCLLCTMLCWHKPSPQKTLIAIFREWHVEFHFIGMQSWCPTSQSTERRMHSFSFFWKPRLFASKNVWNWKCQYLYIRQNISVGKTFLLSNGKLESKFIGMQTCCSIDARIAFACRDIKTMICWKLAEKTLNATSLNLILSSGIIDSLYVFCDFWFLGEITKCGVS